MRKTTLTTALIACSLLALPAVAQTNPPAAAPAPAATATNTQPAQTASSQSLWQGSKFIGLNVYNEQNEKIGDIKDLMLDKDGKIMQVAIGVGGFLGMGEHDVAVKWTELKWSDEPVRSTTSSNTGTRPAGAPETTGTNTAPSSRSTTKNNYPDHAVLSATKDQLKSMPQFDYNK